MNEIEQIQSLRPAAQELLDAFSENTHDDQPLLLPEERAELEQAAAAVRSAQNSVHAVHRKVEAAERERDQLIDDGADHETLRAANAHVDDVRRDLQIAQQRLRPAVAAQNRLVGEIRSAARRRRADRHQFCRALVTELLKPDPLSGDRNPPRGTFGDLVHSLVDAVEKLRNQYWAESFRPQGERELAAETDAAIAALTAPTEATSERGRVRSLVPVGA